MCIGITCFSCGGSSRRSSNRAAKVAYMGIFVIFTVLGLILRFYAHEIFPGLYSFGGCKDSDNCFGVLASYRVSFTLVVFFAVMAFASMASKEIHVSFWTPKLIGLVVLLLVSVFTPNDFFLVYRWFAFVFSILFTLVQVLVLVDFAFDCHEYLLKKLTAFEEEQTQAGYEAPGVCGNPWALTYIVATVILFLVSFVAIIVMFAVLPSCGANIGILAETLILGLVTFAVSISSAVSQGALPPTIVWIYCTFLAYGVIGNNPDAECNPNAKDSGVGDIIVGLLIAVISIAWSTFRAADVSEDVLSLGGSHTLEKEDDKRNADSETHGRPSYGAADSTKPTVSEWGSGGRDPEHDPEGGAGDASRPTYTTDEPHSEGASDETGEKDTYKDVEGKVWIFHVVMLLGSGYLAMLLTGWGTNDPSTDTAPSANPEKSEAAMVSRLCAQIVCQLLYVWILVAPFLCPNREFGAAT